MQNLSNRPAHSNNKCGYKGVYYDSEKRRFRAHIKHNGTQYHLGRFVTPEDAAHAYNLAALRLHGDFARLNDIPMEKVT